MILGRVDDMAHIINGLMIIRRFFAVFGGASGMREAEFAGDEIEHRC